MKKSAISGFAVIMLSWVINTTHAQFEYSVANTNNELSMPGAVKNVKGIHPKAEINFTKTYKNATDVMWYSLNDKRLMVRFFDNGIQTKVFYKTKGNSDAMVRYYTEDKLPDEVKYLVKSTYYGFNIFLVIEVTVGNKTAYLVKIKDENCTKTIRVMNGEMDVVEEFENL